MKIKFNTKSNTVAVYCILVFAACLFLVALVFKYNTFLYYIHKIIKVLSPIIWGIVFAYILNPFVILCDKHLKKLFRRTKKCRSISRTVSIGISLILMLGIIIAIVCSIVPEILNTLEDFIQSLPAYFNNLQNFLTNKISSILEKNPKINDFLNSEFNNIQHVILDYVKKFEPMLDSLIAKDGIIANVTGSAWSFIIGLKDCLLGLIVSIYLLYNKETFIAQAKKIRKFHQDGKLNEAVIDSIMMEQKPETIKITLGEDKLKKYFPKNYTKARMEEIILKLLDKWHRQRENEKER